MKIFNFRKLLISLMLLISLFFFIIIEYYANIVYNKKFQSLWLFVFLFVFYVFFFFLVKIIRTHRKQYLYCLVFCLLFIGFSLRFMWIMIIDTQPISDFKFILNNAIELAQGNKEFLHNNYFYKFPYNLPFTIYEALLYKIFHSVFILKILNVIISTYILWLIYSIAKYAFNEEVALIALFLSIIFPPFIYNTSVLSNQIIALALFLSGLFVFLKKKNIYLTGFLFALGHIFRPIGIVFIIPMLIFLIFEFILSTKKIDMQNIKSIILKILKFLGSYYITIIIIFSLIDKTGIPVKSMFYDPIPHYKFLVGLNYKSNGYYNAEDGNLTNQKNFKELADKKIKERLKDKKKLKTLFLKKIKFFWGLNDFDIFWSKAGLSNKEKKKIPINFLYSLTLIIYQLLVISIVLYLLYMLYSLSKHNEFLTINVFQYYLIIQFIILFVIYLFIEIQGRYRYSIYYILIILGALGIYTFQNKLLNLFSNSYFKLFNFRN